MRVMTVPTSNGGVKEVRQEDFAKRLNIKKAYEWWISRKKKQIELIVVSAIVGALPRVLRCENSLQLSAVKFVLHSIIQKMDSNRWTFCALRNFSSRIWVKFPANPLILPVELWFVSHMASHVANHLFFLKDRNHRTISRNAVVVSSSILVWCFLLPWRTTFASLLSTSNNWWSACELTSEPTGDSLHVSYKFHIVNSLFITITNNRVTKWRHLESFVTSAEKRLRRSTLANTYP